MDALVFSGGGARGAYQIGVYEALHKHGFKPDIVTGTSVGAILATLVTAGCSPDEVKRLWRQACQPGFLSYRRDVHQLRSWNHLRTNDDLQDLLHDEVDWEAVREAPIELRFTAVDVNTAERVTFTNQTATPRSVLASTSIPILFEPQKIGSRHLWDGGLMTSTPLQPAIEEGATRIVAILNEPAHQPAQDPPTTLTEAVDRVIDIVNRRALHQDLQRAEEINRLVETGEASDYWRWIDIHIIEPQRRFDTSVLDFDETDAQRMWVQGRLDGDRFLEGEPLAAGPMDEPGGRGQGLA